MEYRHLCRAKRTDNSEWVEGFYFCMTHPEGRYMHHFIIPVGADLSLGTPIENIQVEVDSDTICWCTGLKDNNEKLIWENDIVKCKYGKAIVKWGEGEWKIEWIEGQIWRKDLFFWSIEGQGYRKDLSFWSMGDVDLKIIGNEFDNPELLSLIHI